MATIPGKATLAASDREGVSVHGILFDLDATDLGEIDRIEGASRGYRREDTFHVVTEPDCVSLMAATYIAEPEFVDPNHCHKGCGRGRG